MITVKNDYVPKMIKPFRSKLETDDTVSFVFPNKTEAYSGQFYMLSRPGIGEAPISVASGHCNPLAFSVKGVGSFTRNLLEDRSSEVGIRGPYGNAWPWKEYDSIVAITGGIGIPPIKSLIEEMSTYGNIDNLTVLYGARSPHDIVYKKEIEMWQSKFNFYLTVDHGDQEWKGNVGLVTTLVPKLKGLEDSAVFLIGPAIMMKNGVKSVIEAGFKEDRIYLSLERRMECGIGACGHCNLGKHYVCEDGPIFNYPDVKDEPELFL
ncbi:MAG: FAD/NAD(P)-binding protein [Thermoplasmata archaeon]